MQAWFRFQLERLALLGPIARILLILGALAFIVGLGGVTAFIIERDEFGSFEGAVWWALLRVSDPGYLDADASSVRLSALSLLLSVSGTAFLVGGIAAVMTHSMNQRLRRLIDGTTPVWFSEHIVIIGWTDRTAHLVAELIERRPRTKVVVLVEEVEEWMREQLQSLMSRPAMMRRVVLRSGLPTQPDHLDRASVDSAAVVIVPEFDAGSDDPRHGPRWLRGLAALRTVLEGVDPEDRPRVVIEVGDATLQNIASRLLPRARLINGDAIAARALVQAVNFPPSSRVLLVGESGTTPVLEQLLSGCAVVDVATLPEDEDEEGLEAREAILAILDQLGRYDRIILVAQRGEGSAEEADEATMASSLVLLSAGLRPKARIVAELLDTQSVSLFESSRIAYSTTPSEVATALANEALDDKDDLDVNPRTITTSSTTPGEPP